MYSHLFSCFWSICSSSSLVNFKNGPDYLTWSTAQVFIPSIRFLLYSFVSRSFLVLLRYSFLIFSFIFACLMVSASKMPKYLWVSFSPSSVFKSYLDLVVPFHPSGVVCCFSLLAWRIFLCQIPSLLPFAVSSTFQVFMVFSIKFLTSSDILYVFR